jgi:pilus biogenesis lipoprotein CpaD
MRMHFYPVAAAVMLSLAACYPLSVEYTASEAPKQLTLDQAAIRVDLRFPPGSSRLVAGEAARLRALAATGQIAPADRVLVSAAGGPALARARVASISEALLPYGVVVSPAVVAEVAPDRAVVETDRYLVSLPPCPNWSKSPVPDEFGNTVNSNFGCATVSNLGRMVANPADLASGQPLGLAAGKPARDAVRRYLFDIDPMGTGVKPLGSAAGASAGGGSAGGAGASAGGPSGSAAGNQ